jgi:hypothetical protein
MRHIRRVNNKSGRYAAYPGKGPVLLFSAVT